MPQPPLLGSAFQRDQFAVGDMAIRFDDCHAEAQHYDAQRGVFDLGHQLGERSRLDLTDVRPMERSCMARSIAVIA